MWRIEQDHVSPGLLFAGTEFGLFVSLDGGARWLPLSGNAPTIPFRDLAIQRRENDLVGATFGRSFWVLDDYAPLRALSEERLEESEFELFEIRPALLYVEDDRLGGLRGSQGDAYFVADNPAFGATFTYYLRDALETRAAQRKEREQELAKEGADTPFPGWDALKQEEREEDPVLFFEIRDAEGELVERVEGSTGSGLHRTSWDLRYASGPLVLPGTYTAQAFQRVDSASRPLGAPQSFEVRSILEPALERQDPGETLAFQQQLEALQQDVSGTLGALDEALEDLRAARDVLEDDRRTPLEAFDQARSVELALLDAREALVGDATASSRSGPSRPSIRGRVQSAYYGTFGQTYGPTGTHRRQAEIAREEFARVRDGVRTAVEVELAELLKRMDALDLPWSSGRPLPAARND